MSPRLAERKTGHMLPDGAAFIPFGERYQPDRTQRLTRDGRIEKITFNISGAMAVYFIETNLLFLQKNGKGDRELVSLLSKAATTLGKVIKDETTCLEVFTLEFKPEEIVGFNNKGLFFRNREEAIEAIKTILVHPDLRFGTGFSRERERIIEAISETIEVLQESL